MTTRECAIVTAYTGICMLEGKNLDEYYKYLHELFGRPVYTHEIPFIADEIKERSREDFIRLCKEAARERTCDGNKDELHSCFPCGADMRGD